MVASFDIRSYASLENSSTIRNLDDIKPFEEEAESTILRAIEKQDKERLKRIELEANPDNSDQKYGILIGVPSEAIHLFSDDNIIEDHQSDIKLDSRSPESGDSLVIVSSRMMNISVSEYIPLTSCLKKNSRHPQQMHLN